MSLSNIPNEIEGYRILPIALPVLPSYPVEATHYLFVKPHEPKNPDATTLRSLYVVNVPFDATDVHLKHLFSVQLDLPAGRIEEIRFEDSKEYRARAARAASFSTPALPVTKAKGKKRKRGADDEVLPEATAELPSTWDRELHKSGSNAIMQFVDRFSMELAFKVIKRARKRGTKLLWGEGVREKLPPLGPERYLTHHKLTYPPKEVLLKSVDDFMTAFNAREAAQARIAARQRKEPDEDGFVKVSRGGRSGAVRQQEALQKLEKQKERQKGFDNFYRFQSREKRKEKAMELIKKFEEDKEKLKRMRAQRGMIRPET